MCKGVREGETNPPAELCNQIFQGGCRGMRLRFKLVREVRLSFNRGRPGSGICPSSVPMRPQKVFLTQKGRGRMGLCRRGMKPGRGGRCRGRIRPPAPSLPHPPGPPLPPHSLLENTKLRLGLSSFPYGERCKPVQCMAGHFVHNFTASGSKTHWGNQLFSSSHLVCTRMDQAMQEPG